MTPYQVMPPLTPKELDELRESIRTNGVLVPILVDQHGVIIDGHHRAEIAQQLNMACPQQMHDGTEEENRSLAYSLNLDRRHLDREQKRELIKQSLKSDPQLSNREHARRVGVDDKTVGKTREHLEASAEIPQIEERQVERGGTTYLQQPAQKPLPSAPRPAPTPEAQQFLQEHLDSSDDLRRRERNKRLQSDLDKAWGFQQWDVALAAEVMEDDDIINLNNLITNLQNWRDRVISERNKPLAIVKEFHK